MKKLVITSMVASLLLAAGAAFGQEDQSQTHQLQVNIPNLVMIRIVDGGNAASVDPTVVFDLTTGTALDALLAMNEAATFEPTLTEQFGDVVVFSNRATWSVSVEATDFVRTNGPDISESEETPLSISAVSVIRPSVVSFPIGVSSVEPTWTLGTASQGIANGVQTRGFRSLGFGGADYRLTLTGEEAPGGYQSTVTYSITAP